MQINLIISADIKTPGEIIITVHFPPEWKPVDDDLKKIVLNRVEHEVFKIRNELKELKPGEKGGDAAESPNA